MPAHFRMRPIAGAVILALAAAGAAQAQSRDGQPMQPPPEGSVITGVTVTVPKVVERTRYGSTTSEVFMSVRVPYGDLDLGTPSGAAELDRKVGEAGEYVCDQLDRMYPTGSPDEFSCTRRAINEARPQVIKARAGR